MDSIPSTSKTVLNVQPAYFTSSLFVDPLRKDIENLTTSFAEQYAQSQVNPFGQFKACWLAQGWRWLHFRTFDGRARHQLIDVVIRLFLGALNVLTCLTMLTTAQSDVSTRRSQFTGSGLCLGCTLSTTRNRAHLLQSYITMHISTYPQVPHVV